MLTALLDAVGSWPAALVLTVAGVVLALESGLLVGVLLPGSTTLVVLGVWSAASGTPAVLPVVVAAVSTVLGALSGWWRGHRGRGARGMPGWLRERVTPVGRRARGWLSAQGPLGTAVVLALAHWVAGTRTLVPRVAGRSGVPLRWAAPVIAVSGTGWTTTVVLLARALGRRVADDAGWVPAVAVAVLLVVLLVRAVWHARATRS